MNDSPASFFHAQPLESDLFEWHFTVRGPPDTAFAQGVYHGRILLPAEYPLKPPEIILLTPNGRFEVGKRICLSVTAHHQETWQPSWGIRTILTALVGFMPSKAEGVGALDYPDEDRRGLARKSHGFRCPRCGAKPVEQLPPREAADPSAPSAPSTVEEGSERSATVNGIVEQSVTPVPLPEDAASSVTELSTGAAPQALAVAAEGADAAVVEGTANQPSASIEDAPVATQAVAEPIAMPQAAEAEPDLVEVDEITPLRPRSTNASSRSPLEPAAEITSISSSGESSVRSESRPPPPETQERELLYIAYAIVVLMIAVIARRVVKIVTE